MKILEILKRTIGSSLVNELDSISYNILTELRSIDSISSDRLGKIRTLIELCRGLIIWINMIDSESKCNHIEKRVDKCENLISRRLDK